MDKICQCLEPKLFHEGNKIGIFITLSRDQYSLSFKKKLKWQCCVYILQPWSWMISAQIFKRTNSQWIFCCFKFMITERQIGCFVNSDGCYRMKLTRRHAGTVFQLRLALHKDHTIRFPGLQKRIFPLNIITSIPFQHNPTFVHITIMYNTDKYIQNLRSNLWRDLSRITRLSFSTNEHTSHSPLHCNKK